jgi:hypothetical protein
VAVRKDPTTTKRLIQRVEEDSRSLGQLAFLAKVTTVLYLGFSGTRKGGGNMAKSDGNQCTSLASLQILSVPLDIPSSTSKSTVPLRCAFHVLPGFQSSVRWYVVSGKILLLPVYQ